MIHHPAVRAVIAVAACILAPPAAADILVLQSNVAGLERGRVLADAETLDVPAGGRVDILRPSGQTRSLRGPFKARVGDLTRGEAADPASWKRVLDDLAAERSAPKREGATRGVSR